ncbi:cation channel sperm-associated targeting subunit tau [Pteronotus mesoamericanus]|uniref:cation channel sperm-associated targeting subunit tau n=1 Tax=Pteronotus mesoamericanus TaxID=1884717 RepID=UPI0023ED957A|nr:cation channel sperm-associated targeting subunit tau [Pteronotus parnellii mesoamericanus]
MLANDWLAHVAVIEENFAQMQRKSESKEPNITPEAANLVPFGDVVGCLAIHIKNCSYFTPQIDLQHCSNLCVRISVNNVVKCTKAYALQPQNTLQNNDKKKSIIKFDEVKYFSVQVPRRQDDVRNNIYLDLMQCDNEDKYTLMLGSVQIHLYEVIQKGCFIEEFQILHKNTFICRIEVEFMFSYGNFGFGFSHQLKPLQKIVEPSMFMNIAPPPERTDPVTNVIIPQLIEYPAFLSPDLNVTVGTPASVPQSNQPSAVRLEKLQQPPRERLENMKKEYRDLHTWREKVIYLEGVLAPKLEHNELERSNTNEIYERQLEEKSEDTVTSDISFVNEEAEIISSELLDNDDKKDLTLPTLNQMDQDHSNAVASKSSESTKQRATPLLIIPSLTITEKNKILLSEDQLEAVTERKLNNVHFKPKVKLKDKHPKISKSNSSASASEVAFSQKGYRAPSLRPEYIEFKPKYQVSNFNTKDSFDPFQRNIKNKMSVRKRKDQDMSQCRNSLSEELIEHEDQDPPYPTHSKTPRPTDKTWPPHVDTAAIKTVDTKEKLTCDPDIITVTTLNTKNNLACDPSISTIKALDIKNKLKERPPNVSLPNLERESSLTRNVNVNTCHFSKSLSLTAHIENLKQSVVLKSVLSKNLQDLSEKLFSKPEFPVDTEARKKSHSSLLLSIHDKPSSSLEDKIFETVQDLNSRLSKGDILYSKCLVNPIIIKDIPAASLSEGGPGTSPEVESELVSEEHLEAGEIAFPMEKKSSFKKKHLESEISSSKPGFSGIAHDCVIKQIFTAPAFSKLEMGVEETSETQMSWQNQLRAAWENLSSNDLVHYEENDEIELPETKSVTSQIMQALPVDALLESGVIKVVELDKEYQENSLLDTEAAFAGEKPKDSIEDYSEIKWKTNSLSQQNIPVIPKESTSSSNRVEFIDKGQNISPQDSKYPSMPDKKTDLPSSSQRLDREEDDLSSTLEHLNNLLLSKFNESDVIILKSFFKNIFNVFLKYNQSEKRRQPEKELERLIQHPFPNNIEDLKGIKEDFDKADKLDRKPHLNPKLCVFLEALSESEIKNLKSELSKHIQHYLIERLSESGHITKADLPKIYQNLYLMNERAEPKGQNVFLEKYSETVKETMSFVNNFNHYFINKHLEIKLKSFLSEILQNYFLKNLSESSLFKETESEPMHSNISSLRTRSASISFHKLGQDISKGSFGRGLEVNMTYPLNKPLQNYLIALSESELLNAKADLSKHIQRFFIEKLSKSGLITERQLEGISNHINLINSSSTSLKCIKPCLSFRDENQFMEKHSEKQNKYSEIVHRAALQKVPEARVIETELTRKEEKEYFPLQHTKENPSTIREQKRCYPKGAKTPTLIKVQPASNKNAQEIPLKKSSEQLTDIVLKKQRKEHGFMQLPQAENFDIKTEIQDPHSWSGKSKTTQSNACFERTPKMKSLGKKEQSNIYKSVVQEKPEAVLSPCPRIPYCKKPNEDEKYMNKFTFSSRQSNTLICFNSEAEENSELEHQFCQRLKGYNNNNKKHHLVTFAHYKKEIQALFITPSEICNERHAKALESQSFQAVKAEKDSKPSLFPEVIKRENLKAKVRKERDHVNTQKKSLKIAKVLPTTPPTTRTLRKSVPRTVLRWTARSTIHDCSDRFEDSPMTSFQHLGKLTSRARLSGKSPDENHDRLKHSARPYTAPEVNKRRESYTGKCTSPRMVSAGLVHRNDTIPDYDIHKTQPKKMFAHS